MMKSSLGAVLLAACTAGSASPAASFRGVPHGAQYLGCWLLETIVPTGQGPSRDQALVRLDSLVQGVRGSAVVATRAGYGGLFRTEGRELALSWSVRGRPDTLHFWTAQAGGPGWRLRWEGDSLAGRATVHGETGLDELSRATATRVSCSGTPLGSKYSPGWTPLPGGPPR